MAEIHGAAAKQRIWLISGTGEGPPLAQELLRRGWWLRVSVVSAAAARAYPLHPRLERQVGALGEGQALQRRLASWPCRWVVDAAHPFAQRLHPAVQQACQTLEQPLLRLQRPVLPLGEATLLKDLAQLQSVSLEGEQLLLAVGARELGKALTLSRASGHAARLLPTPGALSQALQLGLPAEKIACLRPQSGASAHGSVEAALCRRWGITCVLARQSGGAPERLWHQICRDLGLSLLLIQRPNTVQNGLSFEALLARLGAPEAGSEDRLSADGVD